MRSVPPSTSASCFCAFENLKVARLQLHVTSHDMPFPLLFELQRVAGGCMLRLLWSTTHVQECACAQGCGFWAIGCIDISMQQRDSSVRWLRKGHLRQ